MKILGQTLIFFTKRIKFFYNLNYHITHHIPIIATSTGQHIIFMFNSEDQIHIVF